MYLKFIKDLGQHFWTPPTQMPGQIPPAIGHGCPSLNPDVQYGEAPWPLHAKECVTIHSLLALIYQYRKHCLGIFPRSNMLNLELQTKASEIPLLISLSISISANILMDWLPDSVPAFSSADWQASQICWSVFRWVWDCLQRQRRWAFRWTGPTKQGWTKRLHLHWLVENQS